MLITQRPRAAAALTVMVAIAPLVGCAADRRGDAESIRAAVSQLPGVAASTSDFDAGWRRGDQRFSLTAVLRDDATPAQAQAVGRTFTDLTNAEDFSAVDIGLGVKYRVVDAMNHVPLTSSATFAFGKDGRPTGSMVSDALRDWLDIAQARGVQSVRLVGPEPAGSNGPARIGVTVDQAATDGDLRALLEAHPDLGTATWIVVAGSLRQVSTNDPDYPETYEVVGVAPDQTLRALWARIVAELGAAGQISAKSDVAQPDPSAPKTTVGVNFTTARDREQNMAQAWMVLPLLEKLPSPVKVDFDGAVFVIGGCSEPGPGHTSSDLEAELRGKYEKC